MCLTRLPDHPQAAHLLGWSPCDTSLPAPISFLRTCPDPPSRECPGCPSCPSCDALRTRLSTSARGAPIDLGQSPSSISTFDNVAIEMSQRSNRKFSLHLLFDTSYPQSLMQQLGILPAENAPISSNSPGSPRPQLLLDLPPGNTSCSPDPSAVCQ
jgi:hypothetical protein